MALRFTIWVLFLFIALISGWETLAADYSHGDSCSAAGAWHQTNTSGHMDFLICDGAAWRSAIRYNSSGNNLTLDDDPGVAGAGCIQYTSASGGKLQFSNDCTTYTDLDSVGASSIDELSDGIHGDTSLFLGTGAGANDDGTSNASVGIGYNALNAITSNGASVAVGTSALQNATTGYSNVAIGTSALQNLTTGTSNIAIGRQVMRDSTTGSINVGIGTRTLQDSGDGSYNVGIGYSALRLSSGARYNVAVGHEALYNTTGDFNVSVGASSGNDNTTGTDNVFVGYLAGRFNTTGIENVFIGRGAGLTNQANNRNTALGYQAMRHADDTTSGGQTYNTAIGWRALYGSSTAANNTGQRNTVMGGQAGRANTSGSYNAFFGYTVGRNNTSGSDNVFVGSAAGESNQANSRSTAVGFEAMRYANDASTEVQTYNTALGYRALRGSGTAADNTGTRNTVLGSLAGDVNTSGSRNVFIGSEAGINNTTGSYNILIGDNTEAPTAGTSNFLNIGDVIYGSSMYNASGYVGINNSSPSVALDVVGDIHYTGTIVDVSDIRMKYDIAAFDSPLRKLTSLNGFSFKMKGDEKENVEYGVSAQDVHKVFPDLVHEVDDNGTLGVSYTGLIAPMIEAMKEQQDQIENLTAEIEALKAQINNNPEKL